VCVCVCVIDAVGVVRVTQAVPSVVYVATVLMKPPLMTQPHNAVSHWRLTVYAA